MRYQLRHAAGKYWLLDTWQEGVPYKAPLTMNETGADIWNMMAKGLTRDEIVERLCAEYRVPAEEIRNDVIRFQECLEKYGVQGTGGNKPAGGSGKEDA